MSWLPFIIALVVFFLLHAIPVRPAVKGRIVAATSARTFSIGYSLVSLATLTWLIIAANRAPEATLWPLATWQKHLALTLMALACGILALGIARPNPLSFGGAQNDRFDPDQAGIIGWVRHPLLAAIGLWALAHLIANGTLSHVILFGLFAGFAGLGMKIIDRRKKRQLGETWQRFAATKRRLVITSNGILRLALAAGLYAALLWLHPLVIGVSPLP